MKTQAKQISLNAWVWGLGLNSQQVSEIGLARWKKTSSPVVNWEPTANGLVSFSDHRHRESENEITNVDRQWGGERLSMSLQVQRLIERQQSNDKHKVLIADATPT